VIQFQDCVIEDKTLVLDSRTEIYYFGHHATLKNCKLVVKVPARSLVIAKTQLIDCVIDVTRELKDFRWNSAILRGCKFNGKYVGCDFGSRPPTPDDGEISNCDFSEAHMLHWCRFVRCDASTLRFPRWPCIVFLEPVRHLRDLKNVKWPGSSAMIVDVMTDTRLEVAAVTLDANECAKTHGTTPGELKAALQGLDGVIY
jgi:hypothetical protein